MSFRGDLLNAGIRPLGNGGVEISGALIVGGGVVAAFGSGKVIFVDPANGSDSATGRTPTLAVATLPVGYGKLTANQNDVLYYIQGSSGANLTEPLIWAKDYTHFIGLGAPTHVAQRCRIFNTAGATPDAAFASSALLKITAKGCIFKNLYLFQGADKTTEKYYSVWVTGGRNYFENIHFAGMGATASTSNAANAGSTSLFLDGAEENLFQACTIGVDTIVRGSSADNSQLLIDGACKRNEFRDCKFVSYSETTTHAIVKLADATAIDRYLIFRNCIFSNYSVNHAISLAEVFEVPSNVQTHDIIIDSLCMMVGITEWESNDRGQMWISQITGAVATQGIGKEPAT